MSYSFDPISARNSPRGNRWISRRRNKFNDKRLEKVYRSYATHIFTSRSVSIHQSCKTESDAQRYYRFLSNKKVTIPELIQSSCDFSTEVIDGRNLLVLGDSSSFNMNKHSSRIKDLAKMGVLSDWQTPGFHSHVNMVVCPHRGTILGLSDIILWNQPRQKRKVNRSRLSVEEKFSYKWHLGATQSKTVLHKAKRLTFVFDREADNFELFDHLINELASDFVIRQTKSRWIKYLDKELKVQECLDQSPVLGTYKIDVQDLNHYYRQEKRRKRRIARTATLDIKVLKQLELPPTASSKTKNALHVNLIEVKERDCPEEDTEGVICWRLWTTHDVSSIEKVRLVIKYYLMRWMIEQLFRVVKKQGFNQEATQLSTTQAIMKQTVMVLKAGCQVLQLVYSRNNQDAQPIQEVFNNNEIIVMRHLNKKLEGSTLKLQNKNPTEKLSWAAWIIARLGGWKGYDSRKPPGPLTMKRGLEKFNIYFDAFVTFNSS